MFHRQQPSTLLQGTCLGSGQDFRQGVAFLNLERPGAGAAQCRQCGGHAQSCTDILRQNADVGALGAADSDGIIPRCRAAQVGNLINRDGARGALHRLAFAGRLVQRLAVDLDR